MWQTSYQYSIIKITFAKALLSMNCINFYFIPAKLKILVFIGSALSVFVIIRLMSRLCVCHL